MYDPKYRKHVMDITAGELCDYLKRSVPRDAVVFVCGCSQIFLRLSEDKTILNIDDNSLSEIQAYDGCDFINIMGLEGGI